MAGLVFRIIHDYFYSGHPRSALTLTRNFADCTKTTVFSKGFERLHWGFHPNALEQAVFYQVQFPTVSHQILPLPTADHHFYEQDNPNFTATK